MNHGDHGGHDMPMPTGPKCLMNMLWNTQIADTCVVFRQWHISSTWTLVFSCVVIAALGVFYEYMRVQSKVLDVRIASAMVGKGKGRASNGRNSPMPSASVEESAGLLSGRSFFRSPGGGAPVPVLSRVLRASLYGATVFLSFFLMLVFMTYNAYLIFATVFGAALGHYLFESHMDVESILAGADLGKGMACH